MDTSFNTLKQNAYTAGSKAAQIQADTPTLLNQLKQNLVGIFSKDNPIMGARNTALTDYLSTANNTRASTLPSALGDVPGIAGRQMTLSPTQQDAIVSSRNAAALAPLAGYNEILKGMYGNIGDLVGQAGNIYGAQATAAQNEANSALNLYKAAIDEYQARKPTAGSANGVDLSSILALIQSSLGLGDQQKTPDYNGVLDSIYGGASGESQQQTLPSLGAGNAGSSAALAPAQQRQNTGLPKNLVQLPTGSNISTNSLPKSSLLFPQLGLSL